MGVDHIWNGNAVGNPTKSLDGFINQQPIDRELSFNVIGNFPVTVYIGESVLKCIK